MTMGLRSARQQAGAVVGAAIALAAVIRQFPPSQYSFYPVCPIRAWLGVWCPGCGATRALEALLDGRWADASRLNLLFTLLWPVFALTLAMELYSAFRWNRWRPVPASPLAARCLLTIALLFGFARNMHWWFQGFR
jgi:hypothetical protein